MSGKTFLNHEKAVLTVMIQSKTPENAIRIIRNALCCGAEGFGFQMERLDASFRNEEVYRKVFREMREAPVYVTNYRTCNNSGKTDETLAEELLEIADCGATLCDVIGDLFDVQPEQMAVSKDAIEKQMKLIECLHEKGAEVLMSTHLPGTVSAERVMEIALEQKRRGADIVKIVNGSENMEQQIENLRITNLLKKELGIPFLFLSGGESSIHRRLGMKLGNCMHLCVYEHDALSTFLQPLLSVSKMIRDDLGF